MLLGASGDRVVVVSAMLLGELVGYQLQWMLRSLWLMGVASGDRKDYELRDELWLKDALIHLAKTAQREQLTLYQHIRLRLGPQRSREKHPHPPRGVWRLP